MKPSESHTRLLLLDIGNTHCHAAIASPHGLLAHVNIPTGELIGGGAAAALGRLVRGAQVGAAVVCSVVPIATRRTLPVLRTEFGLRPLVLTARTLRGVGLDYPKPETIGPDRLANAIAAKHFFGAPSVVVDFGTALTFDIVDRGGKYVGGIIAPGLAAMTDYLHDKTALLPRIRIREIHSPIGKSTEEAMLVGAVHGYRGLVRQLIGEIRQTLEARRLPVVATGSYAQFMADGLKEITAVRPHLTIEGLRLLWLEYHRLDDSARPASSSKARDSSIRISPVRSPRQVLVM
jgi:type III pantothenate kinase